MDRYAPRVEITDSRLATFARGVNEPEDEVLRAARARSEEADIPAVAQETGALLRFFARLLRARHVAEVGSGGGYSGLWFLGGMDPKGVLTTIEADAGHQALAQRAFSEGGFGGRVRSILGPALTVLPKLADGAYDIVFLDGLTTEYPEYLPHARRLLRPGGLLLADDALAGGGADDSALRDFAQGVREDPELRPVLLPVGGGILAAVLEG